MNSGRRGEILGSGQQDFEGSIFEAFFETFVQGDASKLVRQVSETNQDLQVLGKDISLRHRELIRIRKQQDNINKVSRITSDSFRLFVSIKILN